MELIHQIRDEIVNLQKKGITDFKIPTTHKSFNIIELITEIDNIKTCKCD